MCYFTCQAQNNHHFLRLYWPDVYFLVNSKMAAKKATIVVDVTGLQQRYHP